MAKEFIEHTRKLAQQARDPLPHYQHSAIGYNYRLSNVLRPKEVPQRRKAPDRWLQTHRLTAQRPLRA